MNIKIEEIWSGGDNDGKCSLNRVYDGEKIRWLLTKNGDGHVDITLEDLKQLLDEIKNELYLIGFYPPKTRLGDIAWSLRTRKKED